MFTGTKGLSCRGLALWMAWASSSLPVPVSPVMSTGISEQACSSASRSRLCMRSPEATMRLKAVDLAAVLGVSSTWRKSRWSAMRLCSRARRKTMTSLSGRTGLTR